MVRAVPAAARCLLALLRVAPAPAAARCPWALLRAVPAAARGLRALLQSPVKVTARPARPHCLGARPKLMATAKPTPKARPKQGNLLAAVARRLREGTGLAATTAVPGPSSMVPTSRGEDRTVGNSSRAPGSAPQCRAGREDAPLAQASFAQPQLRVGVATRAGCQPTARHDEGLVGMPGVQEDRPFLHDHRAGDWVCGVCGSTNFARCT